MVRQRRAGRAGALLRARIDGAGTAGATHQGLACNSFYLVKNRGQPRLWPFVGAYLAYVTTCVLVAIRVDRVILYSGFNLRKTALNGL